jgi:hypothetical protein
MRSAMGPSWARLNPSERYSLGTGNNTSRVRVERNLRIQGVVLALVFVVVVVVVVVVEVVADGFCTLGRVRGATVAVVVVVAVEGLDAPLGLGIVRLVGDTIGLDVTKPEGGDDRTG